MELAVTDDEMVVKLAVHHVPSTETTGRTHTTYTEAKQIGQSFSVDLSSFGKVTKVQVRFEPAQGV